MKCKLLRLNACVIFIVLFCYGLIFAETVTLKSGKVIEGEITEKADQYIKINFYGAILTYYLDEIDKIGDKEVSITKANQVKEEKQERYENKDFRLKVIKPAGWEFSEKINNEFPATLTLFYKQSEDRTINGFMTISVGITPRIGKYKKGDEFIRFTDEAFNGMKSSRFIEKPNTSTINGILVRKATVELQDDKGQARIGQVVFFEPTEYGWQVFTIIAMFSRLKQYDNLDHDFLRVVNSIELIKD